MKIYAIVSKLIDYAECKLEMNPADANYMRNEILDILSLPSFEESGKPEPYGDIDALLKEFVETGVEEGVFEETDAPYFCDKIMGALSLLPSETDNKFNRILNTRNSKEATDWLYDYCVNNTYVKKAMLDKNPRFSKDGVIVTINSAKPEFRDPSKAKSGNSVEGGYPSCVICRENEGFCGRGKKTLRTVSLKLGGKDWFWQFSPYGYFYQHGIAVNANHIPMKIDKQTFVNLMDFADKFPHYFVGCNAPLERIGGSVLAHDHYQGGYEKLPLHTARLKKIFYCKDYTDVRIGIVDWQGSVVRVSGYDQTSVAEVSETVRKAWKSYSNEKLGIISCDNGVQFNEISPTVYLRNGGYEMNIILRSNITSKEYPDGVFHAHPEYHMIKKESIGLIEAQGLFILPGRLVEQLSRIESAIVDNEPLPFDLSEFKLVYDEVKQRLGATGSVSVHSAMESELASICNRILQNTAVFKQESDFSEFLESCGFIDERYEYAVSAAGRINVIGEHIDYCGGKVLPASLSLSNVVYVKRNGTDKINLSWTTLPDKVSIDLTDLENFNGTRHAGYQLGCIKVWKNSGRQTVGCDMLFDCNVPFGSGLSSSAAIEVSTLAALSAVSGESIDKTQLAILAQNAEREFTKVNCGIMDQYVSANGQKDCVLMLDCKKISGVVIPLNLGEYAFVVANTNKPHNLVESKYNERRGEAEEALKRLRKISNISCLAELTPERFERVKNVLSERVCKRVKHVVYECDRVNRAADALKRNDCVSLGKLLNESHESLKNDFEVSCKELDVLAESAQNNPYCLGSRMIGGGFGGCTLSLVKKDKIERFKTVVGNKYKELTGNDAVFIDVEIADGLKIRKLI